MNLSRCKALVLFGATGDLAFKQVFPALPALVRDRRLDVPVVGIASAGWGLEQLIVRARESLEAHGSADEQPFSRLGGLLRCVDGDYRGPATSQTLKRELAEPDGRCTI